MKVEIYRFADDCWRLVADDWSICILDEMPTFFEPYDFIKAGVITKWKLLFVKAAPKWEPFEYYGELYKL